MEMYKIALIGLMAVILIMTLKEQTPVYSVVLSVTAGILLLMNIIPKTSAVIKEINDLILYTKIPNEYIKILIKIIGISYIAMFSGELCRDFGQSNIAEKINLAGKMLIMFYSLPIMENLVTNILSIL